MEYKSIVSFHFTRTNVHEVTQLVRLLKPLWGIGNVYADSGYLSMENCRYIAGKGGTPYIKPKKNTTGNVPKGKGWLTNHPYVDMFDRYKSNKEEWLKKYHKRSVIESVFSSIKRKLGGYVTTIKRTMQIAEISLKIIVYNLMILARKKIDEYF
jgi:transposase